MKKDQANSEIASGCTPPWMWFAARQRKYFGVDMTDAGKLWKALSPADTAVEVQKFDDRKAEDEQIKASSKRSLAEGDTPHGLGNAEWPVAPSQITHLCSGDSMLNVASRWHDACGHRVAVSNAARQADIDTPTQFRTCGELYGAYNCREHFSAEDRDRQAELEAHLSLLRRWHKSADQKMCLMIAHHLDVPIEESHPPCWFVLSTAALYNAPEVQEFNYCNCDGEPVAGSELQPILLSTVTNAELATEMLSVGETAIHCVSYRVTLPHSHLLITDIVRSDVDALRTQVNALKARH